MKIFRHLFRFYINGSIHLGLSCLALFCITQQQLFFSLPFSLALFVFLGTVFAYNFVKYESLIRRRKNAIRKELKVIVGFSVVVFCGLLYYCFQLRFQTQLGGFFIVVLTLLYTLPFFPNRSNARNWKGIKIYIVSLCWTLATVFLPALEGDFSLDVMVFVYGLQRFLLVFVLILIFEIVDLKNDDPLLQTVPQQIGVKNTKIVGFALLVLFCVLELVNINGNFNYNIEFLKLKLNFGIAIVIAIALAFANEKRSKYYTSFWVESVPIVWWLFIYITIQ